MRPDGVIFDTINARFFVVMVGHVEGGFYEPYDIFGQFVSPDGQLDGSLIQIADCTEGYGAHNSDVAYDLNNGRLLVTWRHAETNIVYGRLLNSDGTFYGEEINIDYLGDNTTNLYIGESSFDPINNRFAVFFRNWDMGTYIVGKAQLINADGTLYGDEVIFPRYDSMYGWFLVSSTFDTENGKFLIIGDVGSVFGQFLNPDLSLYGEKFDIVSHHTSLHLSDYVVFGAGEIGSLVVWADNSSALPQSSIFGKFVRLEEPVVKVEIDIKPGSDPNSINLSSAGVIPVAILSSETFDATTVNPDTVCLAGAKVKMVGKSGKYLAHEKDVNEDGILDLVCQVVTADSMIEPGESVAVLEAETFDGVQIRGEDDIRIVHDE